MGNTGSAGKIMTNQAFDCDMKIISIASSMKKGNSKATVKEVSLIQDHGLHGDAHAGPWHRQVSFLAAEKIEDARNQGLDAAFGSFAENIATIGIDWEAVSVGSRIILGDSALVEITQKGKQCHARCAIYYLAGDCIMPREGVFGRVVKGGRIRCGDPVRIISES
ncbi:MAG: MOSC domain-containing protein [Desulfatiglandaceae bacterium]